MEETELLNNLCDGGDRVSELRICVVEEETEFLNNVLRKK